MESHIVSGRCIKIDRYLYFILGYSRSGRQRVLQIRQYTFKCNRHIPFNEVYEQEVYMQKCLATGIQSPARCTGMDCNLMVLCEGLRKDQVTIHTRTHTEGLILKSFRELVFDPQIEGSKGFCDARWVADLGQIMCPPRHDPGLIFELV